MKTPPLTVVSELRLTEVIAVQPLKAYDKALLPLKVVSEPRSTDVILEQSRKILEKAWNPLTVVSELRSTEVRGVQPSKAPLS